MYKGEVEIPPLGMVDDLVCVSECGVETAMLNSYINFQTNNKKLQFGVSKCKKIYEFISDFRKKLSHKYQDLFSPSTLDR